MNEYENKIELMKYLNIFWKRKWFILIATFLIIAAAVVTCFLLPLKWEVDAIIDVSKFFFQTERGILQEVKFINPSYIVAQINQAAYNNSIATELNLDIKEFPKLKAEILKNTNLVRISTKEKDVNKAKLVLHSLLNHIKKILDNFADIEIKEADSQIKSNEIEKLILEGEIKASKNKLFIIKQRKQEIEKEMSDIRKKVEKLEKERRSILEKMNRSEFESLAMLIYPNEIQQRLINQNILNNLLGNKKIEEEIINIKIENKEELIKKLENEIKYLNVRKRRIYYSKLIKEPTSSTSPVSPKTFLNVLIAALLGLIISTILTFFFEYLEIQKVKNKG